MKCLSSPLSFAHLLVIISPFSALATGAFASAAQSAFHQPTTIPETTYVPHSYIVEFDPAQVTQQNYETHLDSFYQDLATQHPDWQVEHQFKYDTPDIFMGASFFVRPRSGLKRGINDEFDSAKWTSLVVKKLQESSSVQTLWRDTLVFHQFESVGRGIDLMATDRRMISKDFANHPKQEVPGGGSQERRQTGDKSPALHAYPPHIQQGVDIQHAQGNKGIDQTICVLDTPIDYTNPYLNGGHHAGTPCLGDGCPISYGVYYFSDNSSDDKVMPSPLPKIAPTTDVECFHGTHVAGIIIANGTEFTGGAPQARIASYGVFPCGTGATRDSIIVDAMLKAAKRCDIISASFGTPGDWPNGAGTMAAARIGATKLPVVFSAGNNRFDGAFYLGCPGCAENIIMVASADNQELWGIPLRLDRPIFNGSDTISIQTALPWTYNNTWMHDLPFYFTPGAIEAQGPSGFDACDPLPDDVPDLSSYISVVFRGDCPLSLKGKHLKEKGGRIMVLIANDTLPRTYLSTDSLGIYAGIINSKAGQALLDAFIEKPDFTGTISPDDPFKFISEPNKDVGLISYFSSMGPDNVGLLKPDVTGIGGSILSTFPLPVQNGVFEGTSMSTPLISSTVALYRGKHRHATVPKIRRALVHHGYPALTSHEAGGKPESVYLQGGGIVNITAAIESTTDIKPLHFDFNDATKGKRIFYQEMTVKNEGREQLTYTIEHEVAQSYFALQEGAPDVRKDPKLMIITNPFPNEEQASVRIHPTQFTLAENTTQTIRLHFYPPPLSPRLNLYSGYIRVSSTDGVSRVPYGGIAGVLSSVPAIQKGLSPYNTSLPALYTFNLTEQIQNDTSIWTFDESDDTTFPIFCYALQTPTQQFYVDLVDAEIDYIATVPIIDDVNATQSLLAQFPPVRSGGIKPSSTARSAKRMGDFSPRSEALTGSSKYVNINDVPVVGRLSYANDSIRNNVNTRELDDAGFYSAFPTLYPEYPDQPGVTFELKPGKYRVLLRALRWMAGDRTLEANYDSFLSRTFEYRPANTSK